MKCKKIEMRTRKKGPGRKVTRNHNPLSSRNGFTLLEILVALAILATAVTIMFQLFSASLRNIAVSEDVVAASLKAEAKMREVLSKEELVVDSWEEQTDDGYRFVVNITDTLQQKTDSLPMQLLQVDVAITWTKNSKERSLRLKTYKTVHRQA
ncbi:MAG TPA: prepilin-type N-terminal cleavage/methylation domain-containing protein [Syntrophorhabdus sp.]|nr:prepilin-type N-terminal cleavage/methylation domain-containing protein [Syntrophorhabdus sp.]NMC95776.1 prepilin-type N-terminal cleavage/methylation domain-containing protein [Syntrophorhabdus sp.]HOH27425.1 prepilin-type N-terminal cleavage/methylation domain-containing protein [Syntrophorhabdus sp.]